MCACVCACVNAYDIRLSGVIILLLRCCVFEVIDREIMLVCFLVCFV